MKIAFFSTRKFEKPYFDELNKTKNHTIEYFDERLGEKTVHLAVGCDAISVFPNDDCSGAVLETMKSMDIRFLATRSKGYDHIDLEAAYRLGITVGRVPDYSPYSVAEHTLALLLTLNRKMTQARNRVIKNDFTLEGLVGFDLHGKTAGVIGVGKIGSVVVKLLKGFGCKVIGNDPVQYRMLKDAYDLQYVELDHLLEQSDIVTLHPPLNEETRYLINSRTIARMRQGVVLLNTARGGIVNTADVLDALKSNHIAAYGADVYENEKDIFFRDLSGQDSVDPLLEELVALENVLVTSHQASLTHEAMYDIAYTTLFNIEQWALKLASGNELLPDDNLESDVKPGF
jgi:D-lactate dehydrogenase